MDRVHRLLPRKSFWGVALLALGLSNSPGARAETLEEALVKAYQENPTLLAERAALRATNEDVPEALANWRPTVTVNADQGVIHNSDKLDCGKAPLGLFGSPPDCSYHALNTFQNLWPQGYGLTIEQPIYRGGRTVAQTHEALNLVRAERAKLVDTEQTVFLNVITDYANVLLEQEVVDLSVDNLKILQDHLAATQKRFGNGELTRTDVAESAAASAQALAYRQSAETQLKAYRATYEHDVGMPPAILVRPTLAAPSAATRDEAVAIAGKANPTVAAAEFTADAATDDIDLVAGQGKPSLNLEASISRTKETTESGYRTDNGEVIAELTVPIYQGGAISAQTRGAEQTAAQRKNQLEDSRRAAIQEAGQAWDALEGAKANSVALQAAVDANTTALEGAMQETLTGDRSIFEVITEEQNLYQARVNLAQSRHDEIVYGFTLTQALGQLTARDLRLPVEYYDPDKFLKLPPAKSSLAPANPRSNGR